MQRESLMRTQRGISLFIVLVMVLLSTLLVMWGSRTALMNEMITGNDADYQRAFEAAQAMVRDAEFDIQGSQADGVTPCRSAAGYVGCRTLASGRFFPESIDDFRDLTDALSAGSPTCDQGICVSVAGKLPASKPEFWEDDAALAAMQAKAASYGQYTGAQIAPTVQASNPLLRSGNVRAWYWVEVLPYDESSKLRKDGVKAQPFAPDGVPVVYRITAIAVGLKPNTKAVIQTVFVKRTAKT